MKEQELRLKAGQMGCAYVANQIGKTEIEVMRWREGGINPEVREGFRKLLQSRGIKA